ncbi:MAG: hypothetical protein JO093_20670 [Acidobacteria bacterium]|nr:hypothetical protein [Acidobacteriota bacterium]MBV9071234.1 hypothetical protein [Acidobacteriota bacterium]MBV9188036.1 hypothetical protein [Acidobacteriota bacterium]
MDANRLIKWVVIIALAAFAWIYALPWAKKQIQGHSAPAAAADSSCVTAAQHASETWGSGLHRFVNPPYDLGEWGRFRTDVETQIAAANAACRESSQSCDNARDAMRELRSLVASLDNSITSGTPPPDDAVQRQEAIDTKIEVAAELARGGK